jgi:hypothetical protein
MEQAIPTGFGVGDSKVAWTTPSEGSEWDSCVIALMPNEMTAEEAEWMTIADARMFAANIIAACDAADTYRKQEEAN